MQLQLYSCNPWLKRTTNHQQCSITAQHHLLHALSKADLFQQAVSSAPDAQVLSLVRTPCPQALYLIQKTADLPTTTCITLQGDALTSVMCIADGVNGLPLKATGTILDHRLCSQQSVYDARTTSRIKVRIHCIRDWVVDYGPPVTVWLITDWAWYR